MSTVIEFQDLCRVFQSPSGPVTALDHLNLQVNEGQVFGFLGPNGAGKTTAMHILLGFIAATSGQARILGEDARKSTARQRIGYLQEHPDLYRFLTGCELLSMTGRLFGMRGKPLRQRVEALLEETGLAQAGRRRIATYSRGMMQRIGLAQALIHDPDLVVLDEPTGGLDPIGRMHVRGMITRLQARGKTIFFSSHELSEVELVCDTIAIIARGRTVAQGPTRDLVPPGTRLEPFFMEKVTGT